MVDWIGIGLGLTGVCVDKFQDGPDGGAHGVDGGAAGGDQAGAVVEGLRRRLGGRRLLRGCVALLAAAVATAAFPFLSFSMYAYAHAHTYVHPQTQPRRWTRRARP